MRLNRIITAFRTVSITFAAILISFAGQNPAAADTSIDLSSSAGHSWQILPEGSDANAWRSIRVPGGGWRAQGLNCDFATYRTTVDIPPDAKKPGQTVLLAFDAVNFGAEVNVGPPGGPMTTVAKHINGWMPFQADITSIARASSRLQIEVDVRGRRKFMVNGKYTVPEGATWDDKLEDGILRGVALKIVPDLRIEDVYIRTNTRTSVSAKGPTDTYRTEITVHNASDATRQVEIKTAFTSWNHSSFKYPSDRTTKLQLKPKESKTIDSGYLPWTAGPASYWWPNVPYKPGYTARLHLLTATISVDGRQVHSFVRRFGFRDFAISKRYPIVNTGLAGFETVLNGAHYELNGVRCNLRGDNQQEADFGTDAYGIKPGFGPPSATNPGWPKAVDNLLRLNFNVMRIHQIPATPYMLDVCDEKGLMLVEESPLRGSERGEDFNAGRENMINMDRELVSRDRNHPSTVIWSAANEWTDPISAVVPAILEIDDTRPIIADGVGDFDPRFVNMEHYVSGLGALPATGGKIRTDRPYGETESIWPMDNTWQGFAWMATSVRLRRLRGDSDLRNYVLNNAWSNYVPGESSETEIIEKRVKNMGGDMAIRPAISDPWNNSHIALMQRCYSPVAVCDVDFDRMNARSNAAGDWPTVKPRLPMGEMVNRSIAIFNDDLSGDRLTLKYQVSENGQNTPIVSGTNDLIVPPGQYRVVPIQFKSPQHDASLKLALQIMKGGVLRAREDAIEFRVVSAGINGIADGDYLLINQNSGLPAEIPLADASNGAHLAQGELKSGTAAPEQTWRVKNLGGGHVIIANVASGMVLAVESNAAQDGGPAVQQKANGLTTQAWRLDVQPDGQSFTVINKASGRSLDVYGRSTTPGGRIVVWQANGGDNQLWIFKPVARK